LASSGGGVSFIWPDEGNFPKSDLGVKMKCDAHPTGIPGKFPITRMQNVAGLKITNRSLFFLLFGEKKGLKSGIAVLRHFSCTDRTFATMEKGHNQRVQVDSPG